jgi:SAM-dependent methyltransferase
MVAQEEINYGNQLRFEAISRNTFPILRDLKTLELGPQNGSMFTQYLLEYTNNVTAIELNQVVADNLASNYPCVNIIVDDFNECLRTIGEFEAVIVYGVLYHSHVPLKILEDIANFVKPKYILLENLMGSNSGDTIYIDYEEPNINGMRFTKLKKRCNIVLSLGQNIFNRAMTNLGYTQVDFYDVSMQSNLVQLPGEQKISAYYTTWKLN